MKNVFIKTIVTIILLLTCIIPSFAQEYKYNIYVYYKVKIVEEFFFGGIVEDVEEFFIENDKGLVATINSRSYIVLKTNSDDLFLRTRWGYAGTYEKIKTEKGWHEYTNKLSHGINNYYLEVTNYYGLVNTTKAAFDKKIDKLTFQGEYVLDDNSQQPIQQQYYQPVQELVVQQPVQQVPVAESNDFKSDVDVNIPATGKKSSETFVLIIANEDYQYIDKVKYAARDGEIFKEYCIKTLGVPEKQVRYCPNASFGVINGGVDWLRYALENFEGSRGIVYYCGHGIPDEHTGDAYIIPVDGKGTNMMTCYSLNTLYKTLAATNAENITYFMDACFTGANKEGSMLVAARGVAREPKKETLEGKSVVFSASSGDETAMTNEEQHHGLFTYYLLKKLQDTKGDVSYEELAAYISKNVKKDAFLLNEKPQNPVVATSPDAQDSWKTMNLK